MQVWYADDARAGGRLRYLRLWWDLLLFVGPSFGYFPNACKTWLLVKPDRLKEADMHFAGTGVRVTTDGRPCLGSPIGSKSCCDDFIATKVNEWV